MTLQDLGNVGELVGALATVATLVYLAVQIRQNTTSVRAASYHAGSTAWSAIFSQVALDPKAAEIYHAGRVSLDELSKEDARRADLLFDAMLAQIENFYVQFLNGQHPESNQERFARILQAQFQTPGFRRYWPRRRDFFTAEFVEYIEKELELVPDGVAVGTGPPPNKAMKTDVE